MRVVYIMVLVLLSASSQALSTGVVLNSAPVNDEYAQSKLLLKRAYENIGVNVTLTELPYIRSMVSANSGAIDGLDLQLEAHAQNYDNLIKVNVPLLISRTIVVVHRSFCNSCDLDELGSLAVVSGFSFPGEDLHLSNEKNYVIEMASHQQLYRFFEGNRVNAIITSEIFLPDDLRDNQKYRYIEIARQTVFHYLHKSHAALAKELEASLNDISLEFATKENASQVKHKKDGQPPANLFLLNYSSHSVGG